MESNLDEYDALRIRIDEQLDHVGNSSDDRGDEFTYPSHLSECDDPYHNDLHMDASSSSSLYVAQDIDDEPVDLENNRLVWLPPEPELYDDYDEDNYDEDDYDEDDKADGNLGIGEFRNWDKYEEHMKGTKNIFDGHLRALVSQLLQVEKVGESDEDDDNDKSNWSEIITSLLWEAAFLLKPDTSKNGGMDPRDYVKIKCLASGRPMDSMVVKGVVCKKNLAHRRMASRIEKPRLLILKGALEYYRASNLVSSFDNLLQQEMDHLKMVVAKIDEHHPDILLVEKSVSRYAQEYLLAKNISLVLNIKRPLLERIARFTRAEIVPSIDQLASQKLGYCDTFYVDKILEEHGTGGERSDKLVKTLMYFEGCPKLFGCTILLKGASGDELKKVKNLVQYGVLVAYRLALETSFLADEGASITELALNSPLTVALFEKASSIDRSISIMNHKPQTMQDNLLPKCSQIDDTDKVESYDQPLDENKEDHHSILVSLLSYCVPKGFVCERSRLFCIKYYGNFDKPLGRFLRDDLFDQAYRCPSCEMRSEAHVQCYTHRQGTLTIYVKKLTETTLPRGNEGKIWIWNRCLRCPRVNGFPPSTSRVLMSDAASGLSFGKFLELSFSDHVDATRVANCGHSLHHDCLRFYGLGEMVACFCYALISVHSVYLPPSKLVFTYENQQWIQNEVHQVVSRAELLFSEIHNSLTQMSQSRREIADLEDMLQNEKAEFEGSLEKIFNQNGPTMIDIFEINRLKRQLLFQSYVWDHRLVYAASVIINNSPVDSDIIQDSSSTWFSMPFLNLYTSLNKNLLPFSNLNEYRAIYISSYHESKLQRGAHLLLPVGINDTVVPVYDDEPTSIISYALLSPDYVSQMSQSADSAMSQSFKVDFADNGRHGKVRYSVTCYYAKRFESLRTICCPSELDYIRSLSRCNKRGNKGGKSNVFFAKDDRFIIKQVTKTEMESFNKFGPSYFKYLSESISSGSRTCLAKILGIYQVSKQMKRGKKVKMDVLVMENLLFGRNLARLYDLNGSSSSRYNPDSNGSNKILLDHNLIESMPTSPIFVGNKAKRLLEIAVWNDTSFLASIDVMDYSLLAGVDEEKHELVLGIIGFMRQYTWDKHLETRVNAFGIHGGPKNASPTVISPKQYKKRFRKAMTTYFHMVPDQWSLTPSEEGQRETFDDATD